MLPKRYELVEPRVRRMLCLIDALGAPFSWARRLCRRVLDPQQVHSILVVCNYGLGDAVLSTGCFRALRDRFPQARIDAVAGPRSLEIVRTFPFFDRIYSVDHPLYRLRKGQPAMWREFRDAMREIRLRSYDVCLDLLGDLAGCWVAYCSGARIRVAHATMGGGFLLTHVVPRQPANRSQRSILAEPLALLGIEPRDFPLEVFYSPSDLAAAQAKLGAVGHHGEPLAVLAPGALHQSKTWPAERFGELAARLATEQGMFVCLVGGPADRVTAGQALAHAGDHAVNLCGELSLKQTVALIAGGRLFVGNDSGLTHVAAAAGVPVVQLFGPGLPERFGHHGPRDVVFAAPRCRHHPCSPYSCRVPDQWCMKNITVAEVYAGIIEKVLAPPPA